MDDLVVGAGILGLAHAYHLAKSGRRVLVVERGRKAVGASCRNFGMVWPIGQPAGELEAMALASRGHWLNVVREAGFCTWPIMRTKPRFWPNIRNGSATARPTWPPSESY